MSELNAKIVKLEDDHYWVVVSYDGNVVDRIPCKNYETAEKVQECILYDRQPQSVTA
jgi:hypothetical protein